MIYDKRTPYFPRPDNVPLSTVSPRVPELLPCPVCKGTESCDHTVLERRRAAEQQGSPETTHGDQ